MYVCIYYASGKLPGRRLDLQFNNMKTTFIHSYDDLLYISYISMNDLVYLSKLSRSITIFPLNLLDVLIINKQIYKHVLIP